MHALWARNPHPLMQPTVHSHRLLQCHVRTFRTPIGLYSTVEFHLMPPQFAPWESRESREGDATWPAWPSTPHRPFDRVEMGPTRIAFSPISRIGQRYEFRVSLFRLRFAVAHLTVPFLRQSGGKVPGWKKLPENRFLFFYSLFMKKARVGKKWN